MKDTLANYVTTNDNGGRLITSKLKQAKGHTAMIRNGIAEGKTVYQCSNQVLKTYYFNDPFYKAAVVKEFGIRAKAASKALGREITTLGFWRAIKTF